MFLAVTCQHASGACQSHSHPVLSLCEASQKYVELSPSTPPFLKLQFQEKDLTPTPNLLQIWPIILPLGHILSHKVVRIDNIRSTSDHGMNNICKLVIECETSVVFAWWKQKEFCQMSTTCNYLEDGI
jgi:hypothetical protein